MRIRKPHGCDFLITLVETGLSPEDLGDPKVSLRLAASAAESVYRFRADHDLLDAELQALARRRHLNPQPPLHKRAHALFPKTPQ